MNGCKSRSTCICFKQCILQVIVEARVEIFIFNTSSVNIRTDTRHFAALCKKFILSPILIHQLIGLTIEFYSNGCGQHTCNRPMRSSQSFYLTRRLIILCLGFTRVRKTFTKVYITSV